MMVIMMSVGVVVVVVLVVMKEMKGEGGEGVGKRKGSVEMMWWNNV